jgi:hypothetical protein
MMALGLMAVIRLVSYDIFMPTVSAGNLFSGFTRLPRYLIFEAGGGSEVK